MITPGRNSSDGHRRYEVSSRATVSSRIGRYHSSCHDTDEHNRHRSNSRDSRDYRENGSKRSRYESEGSRRTRGRSDWDDGRWEWEDSPRRDNRSSSSRHHQPSPSPMLLAASPDARLVSPWLGGNTPQSAGRAASPWDSVAPSPVLIRASGSSVRSSSSRYGSRSHRLPSPAEKAQYPENEEDGKSCFTKDINQDITESMRMEMEYNSDRACCIHITSILLGFCIQ